MSNTRKAALMDKLLSSDAKAELLLLFNNDPLLQEENDMLAKRIGRRGEEINDDLKDFLDIGLLRKRRVGNKEVVCLDRKRAAEIHKIIASQIAFSLESE